MAGRSEARIFTSIWKDKDFLTLTGPAQRLYFFLLSQPELTHCGVMPLRPPTRWVRYGAGLTVEEIQAALKELEGGAPNPFVLSDSETGELLVRSLIRRDRVLRQPYVFTSAVESLDEVASPFLRAAILTELERAHAEGDVNDKVLPKLETLIDTLRAEVRQTLPERVSETLSGSVSETVYQTQTETVPETVAETDTGTDPETLSSPSQGKGARNDGREVTVPRSPNPDPPAIPPPADAKASGLDMVLDEHHSGTKPARKRATRKAGRKPNRTKTDDQADELTNGFWERYSTTTAQTWIAIRQIVLNTLNNGVARDDLAHALDAVGRERQPVTANVLTMALGRVDGNRRRPQHNRPPGADPGQFTDEDYRNGQRF